MFEWHKKEKPVFTGIARGVGGFGFGKSAAGGAGPGFALVAQATGGIVHTPGNGYRYHIFLYPNSDSFIAGNNISGLTVDMLLIAGGGAGGSYYGGGGGAGGVVQYVGFPVISGAPYSIVVGNGGADANPGTKVGGNGENSTFTGLPGGVITALGGGGAAPTGNPIPSFPTVTGGPAGEGGSGGGAGAVPGRLSGGRGLQPVQNSAYIPLPEFNQYGNKGGDYPPASTGYAPTGGGGAGAEGGDGFESSGAAAGGVGLEFPRFPGPNLPTLSPVLPRMGPTGLYYAGGGGASGYNTPGSLGGYGGGGAGSGYPGAINTGANGLGGGGGGRHPGNQSPTPFTNGGSGICIIRYQPI
jgi:hypothetical protein